MPELQTFSESWYRIAGQRICLRPGIRVSRQNFRGERWMVLQNPFSNQFFRMRPAAYDFVARLTRDRTVEEVWKQCLEHAPDEAPGQEAVIQLLAQLYHANLLQYDLAADTAQLFKRYEQVRQRQTRATLLNLMFLRIPLLDPDRFLIKAMPVIGKLISPIGALLWLFVVGFGVKTAVDHWGDLRLQSEGVLAPGNLLLLYLGLIFIKTIHEFGHAFFCRKFGGEVHVMGILFMIFTPMPYVDASSSWGFRERWKKVLVGCAGMITELFFAAIMCFVWAKTGRGTLHSLAYNIMFVASVSTIVFNINPLLRYDGYYILSDLLEIPNLYQRSLLQLRYLAERYAFGLKKAESPAHSRRESIWITVYGLASGVYRVVVFSAILLFVADRFLLIGILMAIICLISWIFVPMFGLMRYLAASPRLERQRLRAIAVTTAFAAILFVGLGVVPVPGHFRAPGVLQAKTWSGVINEAPGRLEKIAAEPGQSVRTGQVLLRLRNPEIESEHNSSKANVAEIQARILAAMPTNTANLKPLYSQLESAQKRMQRVERDLAALEIRARHDGIWISPTVREWNGRWLPRGTELGMVVDPSSFEFAATVLQEDVDRLFGRQMSGSELRLNGESGVKLKVNQLKIVPGGQQNLPSAALSWRAGGEVPTQPQDTEGRKAIEPFFEVRGDVAPAGGLTLLHGRSGKIRFNTESQPLLSRGLRRLYQLLQKRYQI